MDNSEELVIGIKKSIADQLEEYLVKQKVEQGCLIGSSCYLNQIDRFAPVPGIADEDHFTPDMKVRIPVERDFFLSQTIERSRAGCVQQNFRF